MTDALSRNLFSEYKDFGEMEIPNISIYLSESINIPIYRERILFVQKFGINSMQSQG